MAYADDLLMMADDVKAARKLLKVYQGFFEQHHLALNVDKCAAISVGRAPGRRLFWGETCDSREIWTTHYEHSSHK